jgi:hypothetical protein
VLKRGGGAAAPLVRGPGGAPAIARATSPLPHYATSSGVGGRGDLVFGSQSAPAAAIGPGGVPGGSRQLFSSPNSVMGPQLAMAARGGGLGAILALLRGYRGAGGGGCGGGGFGSLSGQEQELPGRFSIYGADPSVRRSPFNPFLGG